MLDYQNFKWDKHEIDLFLEELKTLGNPEKVAWTTRIINTKMPVLAIMSKELKELIKLMKKTDLEVYLDLKLFDYYELTVIYGHLIMELKDFNEIKKYLEILSQVAENWATCDTIPFKRIVKKHYNELFELAFEYAKSALPFQRRIGMIILFEYGNDEEELKRIFKLLNEFYSEEEYYVNMVNAWLISHLFIKNRDATIKFLNNHNLNKFTINKAVQKCRDSFRVTNEDKEELLKYKVKNA